MSMENSKLQYRLIRYGKINSLTDNGKIISLTSDRNWIKLYSIQSLNVIFPSHKF